MPQRRNDTPPRRNVGNSNQYRARTSANTISQQTRGSSKPTSRRSTQSSQPRSRQSNSSNDRTYPAARNRSSAQRSQIDNRGYRNNTGQRRSNPHAMTSYNQPRQSNIRILSILKIVLVIVVLGAVFFGIDAIRYRGKIFPNVHVGAVDVGKMDAEEALQAIELYYAPVVSSNSITIYASEEAKQKVKNGVETGTAIADDESLEDAQKNTLAWNRNASDLQAAVSSKELAYEALAVGRSDGGLLKRIGTMIFGSNVEPYGSYSKTALESLAMSIDSTIGKTRVDSYVEISEGTAVPVAGQDGNMINRDELLSRVNTAFLTENPDESQSSFIANAEYAPQRITATEAENTASRINNAIANGAELNYQGHSWKVDKITLGDWTTTEIIEEGSGYRLSAVLDATKTQTDLLLKSTEVSGEGMITVSFEKSSDGAISVIPSSTSGMMPNVSSAKTELSSSLFGEDGLGKNASSDNHCVEISQIEVPSSLSFDEAFEEGLIVLISTYTTEYSTGTEARANRNYNIHLCAQLIDSSICKSNGGEWSFNDTTGNCNEEAGFKSAGVVQDGEYTDSYGGGICQVATTVFNSVYEAGYPIPMRFNHSIYPDSYPRGRDAAVDYGGYNLIWKNDTKSDVLLKASCTDNTVTVDLYGISPRLHVETTVSDWEEGEKYGQTIYVDESLPEGTDYIKKQGEDGGSLVTTRYVYDSSNNLIRTDVFNSEYVAQDEIRILGAGKESEELLNQKKAKKLTDEIKAHL